MEILKIIVCAITLFFCGCDNREEKALFIINTASEFSLNQPAAEKLHSMYTIVASNPLEDELAFANYQSPVGVVTTDLQGNFRKVVGNEGRGPGEIQSARFFGYDTSGNLVILDKSSASFNYFNMKTGEVNSFDYPIDKGISITSREIQYCKGFWYAGIELLGEPTYTSTPTIGKFDSVFTLVDTLGGYDPFFKGRKGIMQETTIEVDCENGQVFTAQTKTPYIQVFSLRKGMSKHKRRSIEKPKNFMLSDTFVELVSNPQEMNRFLSEDQSMTLHIFKNKQFVLQVYRNERGEYKIPRRLNESDHYLAVYDKRTLNLLGEKKLDGAILGTTNNDELILLKDEDKYRFRLLDIKPNGGALTNR